MATRADHPIDLLTQTNWDDVAASGKPTAENKSMAALATSGDGDLACNTAMAKTPVFGGYVVPYIRGIAVTIGNGTKDKCCYLSGDGGATARAFADVAAGDKLYWNPTVAGYNLQAGWRIDLYYLESYSGAIGGGGASVSSIVTTGAIELWVRPVDGDDSNSGTSSSTPLATIQAAINKIPPIVLHKVVIHVGMHTGSAHAAWLLGPRQLRANIWILFDGGGTVGDDGFTELLAAEQLSSVPTQGHVQFLQLNTIHEYRGKTLEIVDGSGAGDRRTIQDSEPSGGINQWLEVYTCADLSSGVAPGDIARIVEPKAAMYLPPALNGRANEYRAIVTGCGNGGSDYYSQDYSGKVFVVNAKIKPDPSLAVGAVACLDSTVVFLGCELDPLTLIATSNSSRMMYGIEDGAYDYWVPSAVDDGVGAVQRSSWYGWGIYCPDGPAGYYFGGAPERGHHHHAGIIVASQANFYYSSVEVFGGNFFGDAGESGGSVDVGLSRVSLTSKGANKTLVYGPRADKSAIRCWLRGELFIQYTKITGIGDGIVVEQESLCDGFYSAAYTEIDVSGFGIRMRKSGKLGVGVSGGGDAGAIVGAAGDISMDDGASSFGGETVTSGTSKFEGDPHGTALWGR